MQPTLFPRRATIQFLQECDHGPVLFIACNSSSDDVEELVQTRGCVQHISTWVLIDTGSSTVAQGHGESAHRRLHTCMFVRQNAEVEEEGSCHLAGRGTDAVHEAHVCGQWWEQLVRLRGGAVRRAVSVGSPARQGGASDERRE